MSRIGLGAVGLTGSLVCVCQPLKLYPKPELLSQGLEKGKRRAEIFPNP